MQFIQEMLVFHILFQTIFDQRNDSICLWCDALELAIVNGERRVGRLIVCNRKKNKLRRMNQ